MRSSPRRSASSAANVIAASESSDPSQPTTTPCVPGPAARGTTATGHLAAAAIFGGALLIGGIFGSAATWALDVVLEGIGIVHDGILLTLTARALSLLFSLAINIAAIAGLARFLIGITVPWRVIVPGSILGGAVTLYGALWLLG